MSCGSCTHTAVVSAVSGSEHWVAPGRAEVDVGSEEEGVGGAAGQGEGAGEGEGEEREGQGNDQGRKGETGKTEGYRGKAGCIISYCVKYVAFYVVCSQF